jgi:hypothetical protein
MPLYTIDQLLSLSPAEIQEMLEPERIELNDVEFRAVTSAVIMEGLGTLKALRVTTSRFMKMLRRQVFLKNLDSFFKEVLRRSEIPVGDRMSLQEILCAYIIHTKLEGQLGPITGEQAAIQEQAEKLVGAIEGILDSVQMAKHQNRDVLIKEKVMEEFVKRHHAFKVGLDAFNDFTASEDMSIKLASALFNLFTARKTIRRLGALIVGSHGGEFESIEASILKNRCIESKHTKELDDTVPTLKVASLHVDVLDPLATFMDAMIESLSDKVSTFQSSDSRVLPFGAKLQVYRDKRADISLRLGTLSELERMD